jgi:hypothetical protein
MATVAALVTFPVQVTPPSVEYCNCHVPRAPLNVHSTRKLIAMFEVPVSVKVGGDVPVAVTGLIGDCTTIVQVPLAAVFPVIPPITTRCPETSP